MPKHRCNAAQTHFKQKKNDINAMVNNNTNGHITCFLPGTKVEGDRGLSATNTADS